MGSKTPVRTTDNLRSKDEFEIVIGLSEGPIEGLVEGDKSIYLGDTPLQNQDNSYNFDLFQTTFLPGNNPADKVTPRLGGFSNNTNVGVNLFSGTPVVRQTQSGEIDYIDVRINVSALYLQNDNGVFNNTVIFRIEYKPAPTSDWAKFFDKDLEVTGKTTSTYIAEYRQKVKRMSVPYDIRVTKISAESDAENFREITWESFQEIDADPRAYNDTAILQVSGQATDQLSSIPQIKGIYRGLKVKVPTNYNPATRAYTGIWDGTFQVAWTNNPAWILYDFVTNTRYGIGAYYTVDMDKYDVYEAGQWCDELVPDGEGGLQPRYTFNMVIQEARSGREMARYLAGVFNAAIVDNLDESVGLRVDKDDPSVALFTPENVAETGFDYSYTDLTNRYNDITVTFINPDLEWQEDRRRVYDQASIDAVGRVPLDFIAVGCTNAGEAVRRAQYKLLTSLTEKEMVRFTTNRVGMYLKEWDVILIADPDMGYAVSGRIQSINGARTQITLRDPVYLEVGVDYKIKVQYASQVIERDVLPISTGNTVTLTLPTPLPSGIPAQAVFSLEDQAGGLNGLPKPYRIVSIKEVDGNPDMHDINAIEINRFKFDSADNLGSLEAPQYSKNPNKNIAPPTNMSFSDASFMATDGTYRPRLRVDWVAPAGLTGILYDLQYRLSTDTAFENTLQIDEGITFAVLSVLEDRQDWTVRVRAKNRLGLVSDWLEATSSDDIPNDAPPGVVTGLTAVGSFRTITLNWTNPSDPDLGKLEIWENNTNDLNTATKIGGSTTTHFVRTGLGNATQKFYWVRAIDRSGNIGQFNNNLGTTAITTLITTDDVVEDFIDSSLVLPLISGAIEDSAIIQSHNKAVLNLIESVNNRFVDFKAEQGDTRESFTLVEATIDNVAFDLEAEVTQREVLAVQVSDNTAAVISEQTARADGDSALASSISVLTASVGANSAAITNEAIARADGDSANALSISQVSSTVGGNTSSISVLQSSVNGIEAQWVVRLDNNGRVAGIGLASGAGGTSEFAIVADKFAMAFPTNPGSTPIVPFLIQDEGGTPTLRFQGKITATSIDAGLITGTMVGGNTLQTGNIAPEAVSSSYFNTDPLVTPIPTSGVTGGATIENLGVPSGEIDNYRFQFTATAEPEFTDAANSTIYWRIANNLYGVTSWQVLGTHTPAQELDLGEFGMVTVPPTTYIGKTTISANYTPVSASETIYQIQFYCTDATGVSAKNLDLTVTVSKR